MSDFDDLSKKANKIYGKHSERINRIEIYEDMYHMRWDVKFTEGNWVQKLASPEPHNAIKGITRLIVSTKPSLKVTVEADDTTYDERVEDICYELLRQADKRTPWMFMYDLAMSATIAGEAYVKVLNIEDTAKYLQSRKNTGLWRRYERLRAERPFVFEVYNPKTVFPEFGPLGLESITVRTERDRWEVEQFWGKEALPSEASASNSEDRDAKVTVWEYYDFNEFAIWVDGAKKFAWHEKNELGFIPWAGSIVEGSGIFDKLEDQRLPLLYPVYMSGYWHAQSYADSIMYSLALNLGKLPQIIANLEDPTRSAKELVDWDTPLGIIKLGLNEKADSFNKRVIDESLQIAKQIADNRVNEMMIPKQVLGASPDRVMAFASLNLLVQSGRLPMVPIQKMVGVILGEALEIPFMWAKATNKIYEIRSPEGTLFINPDEYRNINIDAEIRAEFAQDDAAKVAVSANAVAAGLWSIERAMEFTGVEKPKEEKAKVEDDLERRTKFMAAIQAQAQVMAQVSAQSLMLSRSGGNPNGPSFMPNQVQYRPGTNHWELCGNCAFFQGAGAPCQLVLAPIDPKFTCNQWAPHPSTFQQGQGGNGGNPTNAPALMNPNVQQGGGGGIPAQMGPGQGTFENVTGRDRGGNPITGR